MKKLVTLTISLILAMSLTACSEETKTSDVEFEVSYEIGENGWNKTYLSRAGLDNIEEPEGTKTFSEDENGNVSFTITTANKTTLRNLASAIHSEIGNMSDRCEPKLFEDALDTDTHFKLEYYLAFKAGKKNVSLEMNLEGDILKGTISFS